MVITARSVNCSRALRSKVEVETTGLALIPLLWPDNDNLIHLDTDEFEWYHTHNSPADWYKLLNAHESFRSLYIQVVAGADNAKDNFYALARAPEESSLTYYQHTTQIPGCQGKRAAEVKRSAGRPLQRR